MGQAPPGNSYNESGQGTVFVKVGEFGERFPVHAAWTTEPLKFAKQGDVLICVVGATIGKLNLAIDCAIGRSVAAIRPQSRLDQVFLYYSLMPVTMRLREDSRGTAQGVISRPDLATIAIWCPPLAEQSRIVAKVDELMALCDRLEAARTAREATRDRLAAASLARLGAPDPETFQADARFALDVLPALTARSDQIKQLRQIILNLAVRGKLVPQDPNDEPASELLKRIAKEKARLVKAGEVRTQKVIPALPEPPFSIPSNWRWSQLAEIGVLNPRNEAPDGLEASFVPMPLIAADYGVANQHEIRPWGEIKKGYTHFAEGDVGLAKITPCFENGKSAVFRNLTGGIGAGTTELHIVRPLFVDQEYILLFLKSPHFIETGIPKMTGTAGQKRVPTEYFAHSPFPLPPLAEQSRIVAKVDELMALCDRLEAGLTATAAARRRLLDALLAEALAPAETELEAAE
jgi:type I restriction enzyme S subunit